MKRAMNGSVWTDQAVTIVQPFKVKTMSLDGVGMGV
jgi:hypothetical protein